MRNNTGYYVRYMSCKKIAADRWEPPQTDLLGPESTEDAALVSLRAAKEHGQGSGGFAIIKAWLVFRVEVESEVPT